MIKQTAIVLTSMAVAGTAGIFYETNQASTKNWVAYNRQGMGKSQDITVKAVAKNHGLTPKALLKSIQGFSFKATDKEAKELKLSKGWVVVPDREYHLSFACERPKDPPPVGQEETPWGVAKIEAHQAHAVTKGDKIVVCIPDTGADQDHPELKNMIVGGANFVPSAASWDDDEGHGTHVAGTVAAEINNSGILGVSQAMIAPAKVLDSQGSGYGSWIANGIMWCAQNGADVISMSLGSPWYSGPDPLIMDALDYAHNRGIVSVCAAGNDGQNVGWPAQGCTWAVTATDESDRLAYFSSRGPTVDIAAPGVDVLSTKMGGGFTTMSGTSMATPHVAGVLALAISAKRAGLRADDVGLPVEQQGIGRVNARKSVE